VNAFTLPTLAVLAFSVAVSAAASPTDAGPDAGEIKRGEYVAIASDCEACHTAPGGKTLAGGLPLGSPLGTIYSTNITSSRQYGIGSYSLQQFSDAVRKGIRGDGSHLYPAMPYASYALMTDEDVKALYAYFTHGVAPVEEAPALKTELSFPYNMRFSMLFWNALFLDGKPYAPDPKQSAEWNRGKYLVEGPAHCGECHTPRAFLMQQDRSRQFAGALLGPWYAPNITPDPNSGIGALSADELFRYLKFGKAPGKAQAGGEMGLAVQLSLSKLTDDDLRAIVAYVRSVPAIADGASTKPKFDLGKAYTEVDKFRGVGGGITDGALPGGAAQLFSGNCASCHGFRADGSRDTYFPSLFHNSTLTVAGGRNLVAAILFGVDRTTSEGLAFMPGFGGKATDISALTDGEIAQIANYVMAHYGDPSFDITPEFVRGVRDNQTPEPGIAKLVNIGEWGAGALLILLVLWQVGRRFSRSRA
jgi:mono/diheme cytochrome c family protein